jgi:AcrR family transcriptional regulator
VAKKKRTILNAATILFAEKGFNETTTAELARLTKSAEGTIFYHFKTKTDLFLAILEDVKEGIIQEFDQYVGERDFNNGLEMMEEVIAFFLYLAGHKEEWFRLIQRHYPYEFARVNQECRGHLESIYNTLLDLFEGAIMRGQMDGSIRELHPRKTALLLFSMVNGLIWLKFHDLYDTGTLYNELLAYCRRILVSDNH